MLGEDLHEGRPTTSMKKGWLCRTSYDEKNHEIAPVLNQIKWLSKSSNDDPVVMILIKSSDDDPDREMIQIRWWLEDEDELKMGWSSWYREEDQCWKLCQKNTFLVKRECWCICNFGMYSLVYFMYCTPMFIPGSFCNVIESCHTPMFLLGCSIM